MAFAKKQYFDENSLYDYAVGALGRRMRTVAELKRLLRGRVPKDEIGDTLVTHPKTRFISFTGSRDVGLRINELAAKHNPGQLWIKRTILEMGGKDAIIVDADADL